MPYTFTQSQIAVLRGLIAGRDPDDPTVKFNDVYKQILEFVGSRTDADVETIKIFLMPST